MRPAGATLRLFAQWLRPTTNTKGSDFLRALFLGRFPGEIGRSAAGDPRPKHPNFAVFSARAVSILRLACG